ncbi:MAG: HEAT repeat domain-containing protein [Planctomycetota bacterium]
MSGPAPWFLRFLVLLLLGAAWWEPRLSGDLPEPPVLLVDVSRSTGGRVGAPLPRLEVAPERLLVGAEVLPVRGPARDHEVGIGATRLAEALEVARGLAPGRDLILLGDGRSTEPGALEAAAAVLAAGGRLFTAPPDPPPLDAGLLAARARREGPRVVVEVDVASATRGAGVVHLLQAGRGRLAAAPVTLVPGGFWRVLLADGAPEDAPYEITLELAPGTPDDDPGNDRLFVAAPAGQPTVVLVGDLEAPEPPPAGLVVRVISTPRPDAWAGADALVLSNLPAALVEPHREALERHVAGGGRLVLLGGPDAGRAGGWSGSDVERRLSPFVVRQTPETRRVWVIALDRSASMADGALVHVHDALRAFLRALPADERAGVLPFAGTPDTQLLAPGFIQGGDVAARRALEASLDALSARGDTDLLAAVEEAAQRVAGEVAAERIVLVLGDGDPDRPSPGDPRAAALALARAPARLLAFLSRVEVAAQALVPLARRPEDITVLADPAAIRARLEAFAAEARGAEDRRAGPWSAAPGAEGALGAIEWPRLGWLHDVEPHAESRVLATAQRVAGAAMTQPLAASRALGAGRVLALAWGPEVEPAGRPRREALAALWPWIAEQAARASVGQTADFEGDDLLLARAPWTGAGRIDVFAADAAPGGEPLVALYEQRPGIFRGPAPSLVPSAGLRARPAGRDVEVRLDLPALPPPESRGVGVDLARLEALATAGGGVRLPAATSYRARDVQPGPPLAPGLVALALLVLLVERLLASRAPRDAHATIARHDAPPVARTPSRSVPLLLALALGPGAALIVGCHAAPSANAPRIEGSDYAPPPGEGDRPIYLGTDRMQERVRERLAAASTCGEAERQRIAIDLLRLGEPAVAPLIEALADPDPGVRVLACFVLGQLRDARALDALAARLDDPAQGVRHEAATALLRNGDRRGVDVLLAALEDGDCLVRARAIQVLHEVTGETYGFVANGRADDRAAALCRWRAWRARTEAAGR